MKKAQIDVGLSTESYRRFRVSVVKAATIARY